MSLGGIAIAIGAMVDAVIIMIENAHKHLERDQGRKTALGNHPRRRDRGGPGAVLFAAGHHGFVPAGVHVAGAGRPAVQAAGVHQNVFDGGGGAAVHHARAGADGLVHPRKNSEGGKKSDQPFSDLALQTGRGFGHPVSLAGGGVRRPGRRLGVFPVELAGGASCCRKAGLRNGRSRRAKFFRIKTSARNSCRRFTRATCFTCPRRFRAFRPTKARELIPVTDRIIKSFPEVETVFGKAGRAETATDPAPMDMIETTIRLKPEVRMARRGHRRK